MGEAVTAIRTSWADVLAGLSVAGLMLPEAVAYAAIAGLAPERAILAAIAGGLAYALVGRSRFAIIAPTSSSAAMLAAALATLPGSAADKGLMATVVVAMVAALFLLCAAMRVGSLSDFISRPVLRGFAFGLAITIIVRQLPTLLGLPVHATGFLALVTMIARHLAMTNAASAAIGIAALVLLLILRRTSRLPAAPIVLVLGIAVSFAIDLPQHGVQLVGPVAFALALPEAPAFPFAIWSRLAQLALPLSLILFAESWGTIRSLALRHGDGVNANRELGALGLANFAAALVQGMPAGAGFSAGSANEAAGATSRLAGFGAVLSLLALTLVAGSLVARIPQPVLAAIVIAALGHSLAAAPLRRLYRLDRDQWVAMGAAAAVMLLGVLNGMLFAIALSLGALLRRLSHVRVDELGRVGTSHDFVSLATHDDAKPMKGLAIFRPNAPLFFANADQCLTEVARRCAALTVGTVVVLSLEESDDLDSSAIDALVELDNTLRAHGLTLRLARAHDAVRAILHRCGLDTLYADAGFSVADAVAPFERTLDNAAP